MNDLLTNPRLAGIRLWLKANLSKDFVRGQAAVRSGGCHGLFGFAGLFDFQLLQVNPNVIGGVALFYADHQRA